MIVEEFLNDGTLVKHYNDNGTMILQVETGIMYGEAIDVVPCRYTYAETDEFMDKGDDEEISGDEFLNMIEGVL